MPEYEEEYYLIEAAPRGSDDWGRANGTTTYDTPEAATAAVAPVEGWSYRIMRVRLSQEVVALCG